MIANFPLSKPPGLYLGKAHSSEDWIITAYLQVGTKSFRHYDKSFTQLEDAFEFIKGWVANWKALAEDTWDYVGLEDEEELDVEGTKSGMSIPIQLALSALIKTQAPLVRRKL